MEYALLKPFLKWEYLIPSLFIVNSSWLSKFQKPRETRKFILELQVTLDLAKPFNADRTIFKQASHLFMPFSPFCLSGKITSKALPLVSFFHENKFYWQSAEIRHPYHLGAIKWHFCNDSTPEFCTTLAFNPKST